MPHLSTGIVSRKTQFSFRLHPATARYRHPNATDASGNTKSFCPPAKSPPHFQVAWRYALASKCRQSIKYSTRRHRTQKVSRVRCRYRVLQEYELLPSPLFVREWFRELVSRVGHSMARTICKVGGSRRERLCATPWQTCVPGRSTPGASATRDLSSGISAKAPINRVPGN